MLSIRTLRNRIACGLALVMTCFERVKDSISCRKLCCHTNNGDQTIWRRKVEHQLGINLYSSGTGDGRFIVNVARTRRDLGFPVPSGIRRVLKVRFRGGNQRGQTKRKCDVDEPPLQQPPGKLLRFSRIHEGEVERAKKKRFRVMSRSPVFGRCGGSPDRSDAR